MIYHDVRSKWEILPFSKEKYRRRYEIFEDVFVKMTKVEQERYIKKSGELE